MSDPSRLDDDPQQSRHRRTELSRANTTGEDTSLFHEIHETLRRLLQHMVFVALLTLRLYMLPLLYISHKLASLDDPWYPASWNFILYPGRSAVDCGCCRKREGSGFLSAVWCELSRGFASRLRTSRYLYLLGKILGEDPGILQSAPALSLDNAVVDVQSELDSQQQVPDTHSNEPQPEVSASASEVYHAALVNGTTLDDILAAFEAEEDVSEAEGSYMDVSSNSASKPIVDQQERDVELDTHQYEEVSIQAIPEKKIAPEEAEESTVSQPVATGKENFQQQRKIPTKDVEAAHRGVFANDEDAHMGQAPSCYRTSCTDHVNFDTGGRQKRESSANFKRCPTFVRRHAQTHIPRGSVSSERHSLAVLHDRAMMSSPALGLSSPTKRARLQRKVVVYQDTEKAVMPG